MKKIISILLFLTLACTYITAGLEDNSALDQLPSEVKSNIVQSIAHTSDITDALKALQALARTNKNFAYFLSDPSIKSELAEILLARPGTIAQKKVIAAHFGLQDYITLVDIYGTLETKQQFATLKKITNKLWYKHYIKATKEVITIFEQLPHLDEKASESAYYKIRNLAYQGADINIKYTVFQFNFLSNVMLAQLLSLMSDFIRAGADVNAYSTGGASLLLHATLFFESDNTALAAIKLLLKAGAKATINKKDDTGTTALIYAVSNNYLQTAKALLDSGADMTLSSNYLGTIFQVAEIHSDPEMLKMLQDYQARQQK